MSPIETSLVVFGAVFLGALAGFALRKTLPETHLTHDSKEVIKVGAGLIGTMAALLLGLLVASAKSSYDTKRDEVTQMGAKVAFLDRILAHYGPEAQQSREFLRVGLERVIDQMWPKDSSQVAQLDPSTSGGEKLYDLLNQLQPTTDAQRSLKDQALSVAMEIGRTRWLLMAQQDSSISTPMLVVVVFWLTIVFLSFGLFAPSNLTVLVTLFLCALAVAGAFFLVLELDQPFGGFIQIASSPMKSALAHLGQ